MQNQPILLQWFTIEKLSQVVDLNWQQFKALELVKQAVEAGELDAQINNASVNVRKVFDK
jgi:hypothetical protein